MNVLKELREFLEELSVTEDTSESQYYPWMKDVVSRMDEIEKRIADEAKDKGSSELLDILAMLRGEG